MYRGETRMLSPDDIQILAFAPLYSGCAERNFKAASVRERTWSFS